MSTKFGYDPDQEEGRIVGKDTFGEPIREHDRSVIVGRDRFNEPITAHERYQTEQGENGSATFRPSTRRRSGLEDW